MRKHKIKDIKNRIFYKKMEISKVEFNLISKLKEKNFLFKLEKNKTLNFSTKIVNRCVLSNRSNCIHKKFRLSRIMLRSSVINGLIMGFKKASF
jgi:ribosomal protein S14